MPRKNRCTRKEEFRKLIVRIKREEDASLENRAIEFNVNHFTKVVAIGDFDWSVNVALINGTVVE